jgi:hypothetical protein
MFRVGGSIENCNGCSEINPCEVACVYKCVSVDVLFIFLSPRSQNRDLFNFI